jgi:ATP-dependent RNA helicase SUPV3L1/SUV3
VSLLAPAPEADPEPATDAPPELPEMEVFYTFVWAPKPRGERRHGGKPDRAPRHADAPPQGDRKPREKAQGDRPQGDRPQGERPKTDKPRAERPQGERGDRFKGKGKGKPDTKPDRQKTFEARPPRPEKPIDPDNPFAVLMALKGKV